MRKGLSIAEILISVFILGVVSIILVKLFIASDHINARAKELDNAVLLSVAMAESPVHDYENYLLEYFDGNILKESNNSYTVYYNQDRKFNKTQNSVDNINNRLNIRFLVKKNIQTVELIFSRYDGENWNVFYEIKRDRFW